MIKYRFSKIILTNWAKFDSQVNIKFALRFSKKISNFRENFYRKFYLWFFIFQVYFIKQTPNFTSMFLCFRKYFSVHNTYVVFSPINSNTYPIMDF